MALVLDSPYGAGGYQPDRYRTARFDHSFPDARLNPRTAYVPPHLRQRYPTRPPDTEYVYVPPHLRQWYSLNQPWGAQNTQATRADSDLNGGFRPPTRGYRGYYQVNGWEQTAGAGSNLPPNRATHGFRWPPSAQPRERPTRSQAQGRNASSANNNMPQPFNQTSSTSHANWRRHNGNRGAHSLNNQSNATQNSNDTPPIDLATGQPISKRAAKRRRARARKAVAKEAETRQHEAPRVGQPSQRRQSPHPTPSSNPVPTTPYHGLQAEQTIASTTAGPATIPEANTTRLDSSHLPAAAAPRILTFQSPITSRLGVSSSDADDSSDDENQWGIRRRFLRPTSGAVTTAHQGRTQPEPELRRRANSPCLICLDIPDEFPSFRPTSRCTHPSAVCAPCLEQHIIHAVRSQGSTTPTCPNPECRQVMQYGDVVRGARDNRACLDRYETLLRRRRLENEPNFVRCKSPTCDWGQVHVHGAAVPIVVCEACGARSCFTHDIPWHTGLSCEQYTAHRAMTRAAEDRASQAYIARFAKTCPNSRCRRRIQKVDGCDHMTCHRPGGCGHQFCWVCLANYDPIRREGNHRHNTTCQYYVPIAPTLFREYNDLHAYGRIEHMQHDQLVRPAQGEPNPPYRRLYDPPRPARTPTRPPSPPPSSSSGGFWFFVLFCAYMFFF